MQARGRRGDGPGHVGEDGLIARPVEGQRSVGPADVRRQRHLAVPFDEQHARLPRRRTRWCSGRSPWSRDDCRACPSGKRCVCPGRSRLPGLPRQSQSRVARRRHGMRAARGEGRISSTSTAPPDAVRPNSRAGMTRVSLTTSRSPGRRCSARSRTCVCVSSPERAIEHQQARRVAALGGHLSDQLRRQVELEIRQRHETRLRIESKPQHSPWRSRSKKQAPGGCLLVHVR